MKTIQKRFHSVRRKHVNLGDFPTLYLAVKKQGFSRSTISRWFSKVVDKNDYDAKDRRELINVLTKASRKSSEDDQLRA
ncbi:MAG: hypothetical protein JWN37_665 [Candidatus Nomurabacteria bacterium]|nr:hypothetical protein [Candidatus Nomurabacteria bacterium]